MYVHIISPAQFSFVSAITYIKDDQNFSYDTDAYEALFQRQSDHYSAHHLSHRNDHYHCSNLDRYFRPSSEAFMCATEPISLNDLIFKAHFIL